MGDIYTRDLSRSMRELLIHEQDLTLEEKKYIKVKVEVEIETYKMFYFFKRTKEMDVIVFYVDELPYLAALLSGEIESVETKAKRLFDNFYERIKIVYRINKEITKETIIGGHNDNIEIIFNNERNKLFSFFSI